MTPPKLLACLSSTLPGLERSQWLSWGQPFMGLSRGRAGGGGTDEALLWGELPEAGQGSEKGSLGKCLSTHVHTARQAAASWFIHTY